MYHFTTSSYVFAKRPKFGANNCDPRILSWQQNLLWQLTGWPGSSGKVHMAASSVSCHDGRRDSNTPWTRCNMRVRAPFTSGAKLVKDWNATKTQSKTSEDSWSFKSQRCPVSLRDEHKNENTTSARVSPPIEFWVRTFASNWSKVLKTMISQHCWKRQRHSNIKLKQKIGGSGARIAQLVPILVDSMFLCLWSMCQLNITTHGEVPQPRSHRHPRSICHHFRLFAPRVLRVRGCKRPRTTQHTRNKDLIPQSLPPLRLVARCVSPWPDHLVEIMQQPAQVWKEIGGKQLNTTCDRINGKHVLTCRGFSTSAAASTWPRWNAELIHCPQEVTINFWHFHIHVCNWGKSRKIIQVGIVHGRLSMEYIATTLNISTTTNQKKHWNDRAMKDERHRKKIWQFWILNLETIIINILKPTSIHINIKYRVLTCILWKSNVRDILRTGHVMKQNGVQNYMAHMRAKHLCDSWSGALRLAFAGSLTKTYWNCFVWCYSRGSCRHGWEEHISAWEAVNKNRVTNFFCNVTQVAKKMQPHARWQPHRQKQQQQPHQPSKTTRANTTNHLPTTYQ